MPFSLHSVFCSRLAQRLFALAAGGVFCVRGQAAALVLAVAHSGLSLPVDVAQSEGFFADEGAEVRVVDCKFSLNCMQQLFAGTAQLATVAELPIVASSLERKDFAVLATVATSSRDIRMIGRNSRGVRSAADLVGKRIGVMVGSSSHYYLDTYLQFHGIDPNQIQLVPLASGEFIDAITKGRVDALCTYTRLGSLALKALGADGVVLDEPRIYTATFNLVVTRQTLAQREPELVKVLKALERAEKFIAAQPERAKQILKTTLAADQALADAVFPNFAYRLGLDQSLIAAMEGQARWALREGHAPAGRPVPNYLSFIEYAPLRAAVPSAIAK